MAKTNYKELKDKLESLKGDLSGFKSDEIDQILAMIEDGDVEEDVLAESVDKLMLSMEDTPLLEYLEGVDPEKAKEKFEEGYLEGKIAQVASAALNTIGALKDREIASKQIAQAKANLEGIKDPTGIREFERSPNLELASRLAQRNLSPSQQEFLTAGLQADIDQANVAGQEAARIASGGQAGAFGSYSQAQAQANINNALKLQAAKRQIADAAMGDLSQIAGMQIQENAAAAANDRARANLAYRRYVDESTAAGKALAAGQINQRTARGELFNALPQFTPTVARELRRRNTIGEDFGAPAPAPQTTPVGSIPSMNIGVTNKYNLASPVSVPTLKYDTDNDFINSMNTIDNVNRLYMGI